MKYQKCILGSRPLKILPSLIAGHLKRGQGGCMCRVGNTTVSSRLPTQLLTVLITINSGKHYLIFIWIFFLNDIRCFLKNWMQHLAETTPTHRQAHQLAGKCRRHRILLQLSFIDVQYMYHKKLVRQPHIQFNHASDVCQ